MWKCECGEFNNDALELCVSCERPRLSSSNGQRSEKKEFTARAMFRRIQDFILFDVAFCAMVALYCVFVDGKLLLPEQFTIDVPEVLKTTLPIIAIILFQILLAVNVLRMLYNSALNSERNSLLLQRMYQMLKEDEEKREDK